MFRYAKNIFSFIWLWVLMACLFSMVVGTGCSQNIAEIRVAHERTWSCNQEADRAMYQHDYQTGIFLHERILDKDPTNAIALYHLGYAHGQIGDHRKEVIYYEKAITLGFSTQNIYLNLGMAYGELSVIKKSISAFKKSLEINPENSDAHFGLAMAYYRKGTADKLAEEEFIKTISIDPMYMDARIFLSILYADRGEMKKASHQLREILKIDPTNARARKILENIESQ